MEAATNTQVYFSPHENVIMKIAVKYNLNEECLDDIADVEGSENETDNDYNPSGDESD